MVHSLLWSYLLHFAIMTTAINGIPVLVRDIVPGVSSSNVESLIVYKSKIIFVAQTDAGKELWQSDGTSFGTNIIRDIRTGEQSSWPQNFIIYKEWLFFSADEGIGSGREIWKSDT